FLSGVANVVPVAESERRTRLLALVNSKFDINKPCLDELYGHCARMGVTFNYQEKIRLADAYDRHDGRLFRSVIEDKGTNFDAVERFFQPVEIEGTLAKLHHELHSPTLVRKDSKLRDWAPAILQSLFGGFVFSAFP